MMLMYITKLPEDIWKPTPVFNTDRSKYFGWPESSFLFFYNSFRPTQYLRLLPCYQKPFSRNQFDSSLSALMRNICSINAETFVHSSLQSLG